MHNAFSGQYLLPARFRSLESRVSMSVRFTYDSPARRGNTRTSECFASSSALPNPGSLFPFLVALCILGSVSGCDHQSPESFSVNVTVENEDGDPVEAAKVGVRPCYRVGCAGNARSVHRDGRTKAVTLASFSGAADGKEVILKWKTEEEKENAGFLIERKREGAFEEVDFVEGMGTTSQLQSYRYRDPGRAPGEHTYRLVVIDIEGNKRETDPVSVNIDGTEGTAVQPTFPNPFSAQTTLAIEVGEPATVRSTGETGGDTRGHSGSGGASHIHVAKGGSPRRTVSDPHSSPGGQPDCRSGYGIRRLRWQCVGCCTNRHDLGRRDGVHDQPSALSRPL